MAEDLDDGEFWLPSQFLTDDDILMDFSPSTETESDEDELITGLTHQLARSSIRTTTTCAVHSKKWKLPNSPQSTLCGCVDKEGSSLGSPNGPPSATEEKHGGATLELLNKAAGAVARIKLKNEKTTRTGTGFFDCSNIGQLCPSTRTTTAPLFSQNLFPPLSQVQQQVRHVQQQQLIKSQINDMIKKKNNSNRPLGLPQSAWPPLQVKNQPQTQNQNKKQGIPVVPSIFMGQAGPGPKRESVGTGVFLPRSVTTSPVESGKKSESNPTKTRSGKGNNNRANSQQRRNSKPPTTNQTEIRLPEWTY